MKNVFVINHPLVQHHLVSLQGSPCPLRRLPENGPAAVDPADVRGGEGSEDPADPRPHAALGTANGKVLKQRIGLIPILRAGLGMVDPVLNLISGAEVWHLGFYRDEKTLRPVEYYKKIPKRDAVDVALILDPMLATGGSAIAAVEAMKRWGVKRIKLLCMIAAPEGI